MGSILKVEHKITVKGELLSLSFGDFFGGRFFDVINLTKVPSLFSDLNTGLDCYSDLLCIRLSKFVLKKN